MIHRRLSHVVGPTSEGSRSRLDQRPRQLGSVELSSATMRDQAPACRHGTDQWHTAPFFAGCVGVSSYRVAPALPSPNSARPVGYKSQIIRKMEAEEHRMGRVYAQGTAPRRWLVAVQTVE